MIGLGLSPCQAQVPSPTPKRSVKHARFLRAALRSQPCAPPMELRTD